MAASTLLTLSLSLSALGVSLAPPAAEGEAATDEAFAVEASDDDAQAQPEASDAAEAPAEALAEASTATPPIDEPDFEQEEAYDEAYDDYDYDNYEYVAPNRTMSLTNGYIGLGLAPGMTFHNRGFHPNTRFEIEGGGVLSHDTRDLGVMLGAVAHVTPYYERKAPSWGVDITSTAILGPIYVRTGIGALGGLPRRHRLHETAAAVGGVVGAGLIFDADDAMYRIGLDYDIRVNTYLEPVHTGFVTLRIGCCRD